MIRWRSIASVGGGVPKVSGLNANLSRIKALSSDGAQRQIGAALYAGGQLIEVHAATSITEGSVSGKAHVPSAPGSPPNNDTGVLARNIETVQVDVNRVEVSSNARYAAAQEFGNSRLPERPYMRPAVAAKKREVIQLVSRAVRHIAAGGKVAR